ncbi:hypothetical protein [Reyranella sp.]|uniref:hypothetical protein n=1 Tax=Reyranella sp. TaxID=1929291 RepID=UPI003BAA2D3E
MSNRIPAGRRIERVQTAVHRPQALVVASDRVSGTLVALLNGLGFGSCQVGCVRTALEALGQGKAGEKPPFRVVVSELNLPARSEGLDVARWLLLHARDTRMVIVAETTPFIPWMSPLARIPIVRRPIDPQCLLPHLPPARDLIAAATAAD